MLSGDLPSISPRFTFDIPATVRHAVRQAGVDLRWVNAIHVNRQGDTIELSIIYRLPRMTQEQWERDVDSSHVEAIIMDALLAGQWKRAGYPGGWLQYREAGRNTTDVRGCYFKRQAQGAA